MNKEDIIKIELLRDARVQNMHNGFVFPKQYIMKIYYRNNSIRILDLFSKRDITNIDYFKVLEGTKTKVIFEEYKYE